MPEPETETTATNRRTRPGVAARPRGTPLRDPTYINRHLGIIRAYTSYFTPEVRGTEHIPTEGAALLVGNHNGLFYMPDAWVTALAIVERRGTEQPAYTLTYDLLLSLPVIGTFLRRIGGIPASSDEAERALAAGGLVLSPHAYAYDLVLLIPLTVVTIQRPTVPRWLKRWAFAMLSPLPMLLLLTSKPWLGQVSIAAFVVTAIVAGRADPLSPAVARGGVAAQVAHS